MKKKNKIKNQPLSGINVLDMTNVLSGPFATLILSDLGANIIKVEKPSGDDSRNFGPFIGQKSGYFISLNRGKKSIVLDLKNKKDKDIFKKLLSKVDILVDNFRPGTLEKLGFTWSYLKKNFPKLIHSKISGFGESGPYKDLPAYDIIVQAMGGIMSITGKNRNDFIRVGSSIGDIVASLFCVIGILSQLIWRNKSKKGSKLDLSMLDCQVAILENAITRFSIDKKTPYPLGNDHPSISPFGVFKTKDGVIAIAAGNDKIFQKMCYLIKDYKMSKNDLFIDNQSRNKNLKLLKSRIELKLKRYTSKYWIKLFRKNKVPCSKINNVEDILKDPQIKNRNMILDYKELNLGKFKVTGNPIKLDFLKTIKRPSKSPKLNENKEEILKFFKIT